METESVLVDRHLEMGKVAAAMENATVGRGGVLVFRGPSGIGKTRLLAEALARAAANGFTCLRGVAFQELVSPYHPWVEALEPLGLSHLLGPDPPPRLLALYILSSAGLPAAHAERPEFSDEPELMATMLGAVAEFVRDAIAKPGAPDRVGVLRVAQGNRGFCVLPMGAFGLVAVVEGRETEVFIEELTTLGSEIERRSGKWLRAWDGDVSALEPAALSMREFLGSGKYEGIDLALNGAARRLNVFQNILYGLRRRAGDVPLLIVIDDLQWADPTSLALFHFLARNTSSNRVLLCGAVREEDVPPRPHLRDALDGMRNERLITEIEVGNLGKNDAGILVNNLFSSVSRPPGFTEELMGQAQGNPLYLIEVVRQYREAGEAAFAGTHSGSSGAVAQGHMALPRRIRDLVSQRLRRLDKVPREMLEAASVCGTRFQTAVLGDVTGTGEAEVLRILGRVVNDHGLLRSEGAAWAFDHPVVREVLYEDLPSALKRHYHVRAGEALERAGGPPEEIGEHYAAASDARAVAPLRLAARLSQRRGAHEEAAHLLESALDLVAPEERAQVALEAGQALFDGGQFDRAASWFDRSLWLGLTRALGVESLAKKARALERLGRLTEAEEALGEEPQNSEIEAQARARWLGARAWVRIRALKYEGAENDAREALGLLGDSASDAQLAADCWNTLGGVSYRQGRLKEAVERYSQGLAIAESAQSGTEVARLSTNVTNCLMGLGRLSEAFEMALRCARDAEKSSNRVLQAVSLIKAATAAFCLGDMPRAEGLAREAVPQLEELGLAYRTAEALQVVAMCAVEEERLADAVKAAREAVVRASGAPDYELAAQVDLAEVLAAAGAVDEALALSRTAVRLCRERNAAAQLRRALLVNAQALSCAKRYAEADSLFREAFEQAEEYSAAISYVQGLRWHGECLAGAGRPGEARPLLARAFERAKEIGARREQARCSDSLARLQPS